MIFYTGWASKSHREDLGQAIARDIACIAHWKGRGVAARPITMGRLLDSLLSETVGVDAPESPPADADRRPRDRFGDFEATVGVVPQVRSGDGDAGPTRALVGR
jgi:hypothetical protein